MKSRLRLSIFRYIRLNEDLSNEMKIIIIYRYCSFILTSLLYLAGPPKTGIIFKIGVIVSLYISARIIMDYYIKHSLTVNIARKLVFIETLGITVLILPTGGVNSPFLWYALNPVLAAACFLPIVFSWMNLAFYVTSSAVMSWFLLHEKAAFKTLFYTNYRLLIVSILITLMVQLLSGVTKQLNLKAEQLERKNRELQEANNTITEGMEHIMSLYQIVEALNSQDDKKSVLNIFSEYVNKLTKVESSFIWVNDYKNKGSYFAASDKEIEKNELGLLQKLEETWYSLRNNNEMITLDIGGAVFLCSVIKSNSRQYGIMGIKIDNINEAVLRYGKLMNFLADLSGVVLERFHLEEVNNKLIIVEEQNRIASEMHDSVSQQLFSLSCGIHSIIYKWNLLEDKEKQAQLELIRASAEAAMKEMRSTIYKLSTRKRGEKSFYKTVRTYLDTLSNLNEVEIKLKFDGDEELLSSSLKRILYRVICEASGNSIRHGKSSLIDIRLKIQEQYINLSIKDNGQGFDNNIVKQKRSSGLGLYNMKNLIQGCGGSFEINSSLGEGACIQVEIPRTVIFTNEGVPVAL